MKAKRINKLISILLSLILVLYSFAAPLAYASKVYAQEDPTPTPVESTTDPTQEPVPTSDPTPEPTAEPTVAPELTPTPDPIVEPTMTPEETPVSSENPLATSSPAPEESAVPTATPIPTPTIPPLTSSAYDSWEEQQEVEEAARDAREDEWEAHEDDQLWILNHGGSRENYISGQWEKDQKALEESRAKEAAALAQSSNNEEVLAESSDSGTTLGTSSNQCSGSSGYSSPEEALSSSSGDTNASIAESNDQTGVSNTNCAAINNDVYGGGTSGTNNQIGNEGDVTMTTGQAGGEGSLVNNGNTNTTQTDSLGQAGAQSEDSFTQGVVAENLNTDNDSENLTSATATDTLSVENTNAAYVDNKMTVDATSGVNTVTGNDGKATLTTGDINLIANLLNILNLNITGEDFMHLIVNIFGDLTGDVDIDEIAKNLGFEDEDALEVIATNSETGDDSENTATATYERNTDVTNNNVAEVNNDLTVSGVSGRNNASVNEEGADVLTGRIKVLANLLNFINANFTGDKWTFIMVNVFGSLNGNLIVPGTEGYLGGSAGGQVTAEGVAPGPGSTNVEEASSTDVTTVANANNVELTNNISSNAVSGLNEQNNNEEGNLTSTGGTDVASTILNFLNFNITGDNWVFLIVNVFGKWMGQIVGFAGKTPFNAPSEGTFAALSIGGSGTGGEEVTAANSGTGADSNNTAIATSTTDTSVTNENMAKVTNNVNVEGISGENQLNGNDGSTSLTTGWVELDTNILNIINMNLTGRNWMVVFLNVFGDFMGDLFFGRPPEPPAMPEQLANVPLGLGGVDLAGIGQADSPSQPNSQQGNDENENEESEQVLTNTTVNNQVSGNGTLLRRKIVKTNKEQLITSSYVGTNSLNTDSQAVLGTSANRSGLLGLILNRFEVVKGFISYILLSLRDTFMPIIAGIETNSPINLGRMVFKAN